MAKISFKRYVEQEWGKVPLFLIYAVLEWVLIIVLFVDGFLAFIANEFAKFFEMKIPCLLCTRIDHVLVHRDPDFYYNDSVCESHKKDVSYLAYCHVHKKLSDIRKMCEGCLLSFATEKESDCDTYKSLVGILHKDIEMFVDDDSEVHLTLPAGVKDDPVPNVKSSLHRCSCCGESLKVKTQPKAKRGGGGFVQHAPTPSPRAFGMIKTEEPRMDLSHIRCKELKLSDNEPDQLPPDEDGSNTFRIVKEDGKPARLPLLPEVEDMHEDRTPGSARGNRFFGIPLTDSASNTPRWTRIPRKSPLDKTEFASDTAEGTMPEADGDAMFQHWSRQIRLDRKSLIELYMELDEERNASAVAANEAMAMITRLQQEKAAVQMEALQYQRMMEEQAEYDEEDLQATKDMLNKREDDIKVLEAELEAYRAKYGNLPEEAFMGTGDVVDGDYQGFKTQSHSSDTERPECVSPVHASLAGGNKQENGGQIKQENVGQNKQENVGQTKQENVGQTKQENGHKNDQPPEGKGPENLEKSRTRQDNNRRLGRLKNLDKKNQQSSENLNHLVGEIERGTKTSLMKELTHINERVKALETEDGFINHPGERGKLLSEITENLQKLFHSIAYDDCQDA
ncbi:hypothetical protein Tsubulata_006695 [Turnera subulata]|uniref:GTD-binding domain-containing protein n=1 Tax=Turnera subulata TaxID=218843 RepID=A0A9Q0GNC0_9ROSI|nr:hypothetical protein Tsubulata_006695 [Turnera subulata]